MIVDTSQRSKELIWLSGEVKTPPFSKDSRIEAGYLLRKLQDGELLSMPNSRPMPSIGDSCHELRIKDNEANQIWRIVYLIDSDAIAVLEVFSKKTQKTPNSVIKNCKKRLKQYYEILG